MKPSSSTGRFAEAGWPCAGSPAAPPGAAAATTPSRPLPMAGKRHTLRLDEREGRRSAPGRGHPSVRLGRWWAPLMLVAMLVTLSACGIDRFDAKGWAGLAVDDDALYVTSGEGRVFALNVSGDAEGSAGRPVQLYSPFPSTTMTLGRGLSARPSSAPTQAPPVRGREPLPGHLPGPGGG
ncbi:hypothetical protein GBAR_LOCUS25528 [Geodia barretti]|uniref:Uncharacterized protein n=1 Tax=Geodia barretti TaxID=519541 RepID=A0AA35X5K5_GEOBA|nr:hypothetical protein GBAR_LOCUS25528 [Geodia barretti]